MEGQGDDQERHRCLVRHVIRWRIKDRDGAHKFLYGGLESNGRRLKGWNAQHPGSPLERDVISQWKKGNRGEAGDWR